MRAARRPWLLSLLALACLGSELSALPAEAPPPDWRRALQLPGLGRSSAVAFDPEGSGFAVGDAHGVVRVPSGASPRRVLRSAPVRDLLFADRGVLYAGGEDGLHHIDAEGRSRALSFGAAGAASRDVLRLARAGTRLFVATRAGLFASDDARHWRSLLREGAVRALAARSDEGETELWLVVERELRRIRLGPGPLARAALEVRRVTLPDRSAVDVALDLPGAFVAVLGEERLFVLADAESDPADDARWRVVRPALPPGAASVRLGRAAGGLWLTTDRGLLWARALEGPWRRASAPVGNASLIAVAGDARGLLAAGPAGVFEGRPPVPPGETAASRGTPSSVPPDPSIGAVQAAALRYLELRTDRMGALARGVRQRGWLPVLDLQGGFAEDRHRDTDADEVFTSGEQRRLYDSARGRDRDWSLAVRLSWDLGDTRYHPEAVDVSREAREVIELRDDVLDEVTQLYFDRQRTLDAIARAPPDERHRHVLRAEELAAGLDAWTGGWFGRARSAPSPPAPGLEIQP